MARSEATLLASYRNDRDDLAREELTRRFLPMARSLALRYNRGSEPLDDLIQVASVGLVKAIDRFDPSRGTSFHSYAVPTILGELKRHFRDGVMPIHIPRGLKERALEVGSASEELTAELDREPTVAELAERAGLSPAETIEAMRAATATRTISLDAPVGEENGDAGSIAEVLGEFDATLELADARLALRRAAAVLDGRERTVIQLRFVSDLTQEEIARHIGVSQVHVSRLIRGALEKLRKAIAAPSGASAIAGAQRRLDDRAA
jgi:RNA polymerase sigma-B factor